MHYVIFDQNNNKVPVICTMATLNDFYETAKGDWQSDWTSDFIQSAKLMKYSFRHSETGELIALGAYEDRADGYAIYMTYAEASPENNPNLSSEKKYHRIANAIIGKGIDLSLEAGYNGTVYFQAKTTELFRYYIENYCAIPYQRGSYNLIIFDEDAVSLLRTLKEED